MATEKKMAGYPTFTVYRRTAPRVDGTYNEPTEPQYEGVVFSDGRVAIRWLTQFQSVSVWDSIEDLIAVHGHADEYATEFHWDDGIVQHLDPEGLIAHG